MKKILPAKNPQPPTTALAVMILIGATLLMSACAPNRQTQYHWPEPSAVRALLPQAQTILIQALADPKPMIRVNAIEVVASTKQVGLMPKVQRMLTNQYVPVKFAAALAIGDTKYALAQSTVEQLLNDQNLNVRIAATYAMYKLGQHQYFKVLRDALASKDNTVRANAAMLIGKTADKDASRLLYAALTMRDSDDKVRFQAIESIAALKDEHISPKIWTMLISVYPDVRVLGTRAMGALATTRAHGSLIGMLDDDIVEVRLAAAEQLGILKDPAGQLVVMDVFRKKLTAHMNSQDKERVLAFTARAIGRIGTAKLTDFLPQLLKNQSKIVRLEAARAVFHCVNAAGSQRKPPI